MLSGTLTPGIIKVDAAAAEVDRLQFLLHNNSKKLINAQVLLVFKMFKSLLGV